MTSSDFVTVFIFIFFFFGGWGGVGEGIERGDKPPGKMT